MNSLVNLSSGHDIPQLGLGTWKCERDQVKNAVSHALRNGYTHIDCAIVYENQEEVGQAISEVISSGTLQRGDLFVTSKLWITHLKPEHVEENLDETLGQLSLEYIDLFLIHWPFALKKKEPYTLFPEKENGEHETEQVDLCETWAKLEELVDAGKIKAIGISNFNEEQTTTILNNCRIRPVVNQVECHPFLNQERLREYLTSENIKLEAYSPLGNYFPGVGLMESPMESEVIRNIASSKNKSAAQVILRWHIQKGHIVIPKSITPSRIDENLQVFDFTLDDAEMSNIDALGSKNIRYCNPKFRPGGELAFPGETTAFF
mmetsp:Transcript_37424/g.61723  ORF Transcript_37424/g.61723 Transcript_37424/m.61723 type:complete len:319 (-) Transcript_37424:309-1265(-)